MFFAYPLKRTVLGVSQVCPPVRLTSEQISGCEIMANPIYRVGHYQATRVPFTKKGGGVLIRPRRDQTFVSTLDLSDIG